MRSPREALFRARQEFGNVCLMARSAPRVQASAPLAGLPDPDPVIQCLRKTQFATSIELRASRLLAHRFSLLGLELDLGPEIHWRRDYLRRRETAPAYFRRIPYLDFERAGDHKLIWELNRHQHLVVLAQAYCFTAEARYLDEIVRQIEGWNRENPCQRGINWTSALEVAFRALSWIWIFHLVGDALPRDFRRKFLSLLWQHGKHLEHNLSVYFSPNTHLLGEAVALHALGRLFPDFPDAARWRQTGGAIVLDQMRSQVCADGTHFEQSSYYHVYATDFFLLHTVLEQAPPWYLSKLEAMAEFLWRLMGARRELPYLGDDDGGRVFHPYGVHSQFGRATLASCAVLLHRPVWFASRTDLEEQGIWWLGEKSLALDPAWHAPSGSRLYNDAGIAIMQRGGLRAIVDAGGFGPFGGGHSHSDALSVILDDAEEAILIDPGTYTYVADAAMREWFRGSSAHNTIRIDGRNQASAAGPFRWNGRPRAEVLHCLDGLLAARCSYDGFVHTREVRLRDGYLDVTDHLDGPAGEHDWEQFWHFASNGARERVTISTSHGSIEPFEAYRSSAHGRIEPGTALRVHGKGSFPLTVRTVMEVSSQPVSEPLLHTSARE